MRSALTVRPFDRSRHLAAVLDLVGRSRARRESGAVFHPGGLQWWLRRLGRKGFHVAVLCDEDVLVGVALRDGDEVLVQTDDAHTDARGELLVWAEARVREDRADEVFVCVPEDDPQLCEVVLSRGYPPTERYWYELVYGLSAQPGAPELPAGFEMTSLTPELTDRYVALHRAAWSRPGVPSTYDHRQHELVVAMPDFRYDLVPIVAAPDGALAAYCISWWDPRSASVEIEPLGTHPDFRRQGLARAIVREVLQRGWALGAEDVLVWGGTSNPGAKALYTSAGLRTRRVLREYRAAVDR